MRDAKHEGLANARLRNLDVCDSGGRGTPSNLFKRRTGRTGRLAEDLIAFMLTLPGYEPPNIILDIQPGGNHVIEDSHKKVRYPSPVRCRVLNYGCVVFKVLSGYGRVSGRAASQMSGQESEGGEGPLFSRAALC